MLSTGASTVRRPRLDQRPRDYSKRDDHKPREYEEDVGLQTAAELDQRRNLWQVSPRLFPEHQYEKDCTEQAESKKEAPQRDR